MDPLDILTAELEFTPVPGTEQILPPVPERDLVPIYEAHGNGLFDYHEYSDYGHNLFLVWRELVAASNESFVRVRRFNPAGAMTAEWIIRPPSDGHGDKLDSASGRVSGADFTVGGTVHEITSEQGRRVRAVSATLTGVAVPYPGTQPEQGAFYDMRALAPGGGGDPPPDYTLEQIAEAVLRAIKTDMGGELGGLIQGRAKNGARSGVQVERAAGGSLATLTTTENIGAAYADSAEVFAQLHNVSGAEAIKILVEFGVVRPSAIPTTGPHAWPRALAGFPWGAGG